MIHLIFYIDENFACHSDNPEGTYEPCESAFFDGKCKTFLEGYCFIPAGKTWIREDGEVFTGEMITPRVDYRQLLPYQQQYEETLPKLADMENALNILGVNLHE